LNGVERTDMRIGIIREGKVPPDQRVPLTPEQCTTVMARFPYVELVVQPSDVRRISDEEYEAAGV
jgi:saccharopine dehydrogenase (NAD+, L-lysine-forming)